MTSANANQVSALDVRADGTLGELRSVPAVRRPNDVAVDSRTGDVGAADSAIQIIPAGVFPT